MKYVVWMPCESTLLNPYDNGNYVEATVENKTESARRWQLHKEAYEELSKNAEVADRKIASGHVVAPKSATSAV